MECAVPLKWHRASNGLDFIKNKIDEIIIFFTFLCIFGGFLNCLFFLWKAKKKTCHQATTDQLAKPESPCQFIAIQWQGQCRNDLELIVTLSFSGTICFSTFRRCGRPDHEDSVWSLCIRVISDWFASCHIHVTTGKPIDGGDPWHTISITLWSMTSFGERWNVPKTFSPIAPRVKMSRLMARDPKNDSTFLFDSALHLWWLRF